MQHDIKQTIKENDTTMKRTLMAAAILTLTAGLALGADLVIPVAGSLEGANNSQWQSEITLHNVGSTPLVVSLEYHDKDGAAGTSQVTVPARGTVSLSDVVKTSFNKTGNGAILLDTDDAMLAKLAVTSRTFNVAAEGAEFGQDIPALAIGDASVSGDTVVLAGPADATTNRFNFGIYAVDATTIEWRLVRKDGTVSATKELSYSAGVQVQYSPGLSLFGATAQNNDVVYARVKSGSAFLYGSIVNNKTNDPSYVPGIRTRENLTIIFLGVDDDGDSTVDFTDANGDGILDQKMPIQVGYFPTFFQLFGDLQTAGTYVVEM